MLSDIVAVVRSYNDPSIGDFCRSLVDLVDAVVVVTPTNLEPEGMTERLLRPVRERYSPNVHQVRTLVKDDKSWSAMLNVGLAYARGLISQRSKRFMFKYLLNLSNTTAFKAEHVFAMRSKFESDHRSLGVVGTSFAGHLADGTPEPLGRAYDHPRNTGMMIDLRVFDAHPLLSGFDVRWDGAGGMEDYDFIGKMRALTPYRTTMLNLQVPLRIGRHRDKAEYTKLMEDGLRAVDDYHHQMEWVW